MNSLDDNSHSHPPSRPLETLVDCEDVRNGGDQRFRFRASISIFCPGQSVTGCAIEIGLGFAPIGIPHESQHKPVRPIAQNPEPVLGRNLKFPAGRSGD
jgi:hypothetical protein